MKHYVITGGTNGIGKAIVQEILAHSTDGDDRVLVNYGHNTQRAEEFLASLTPADRAKVVLVKADLSCEEGLDAFVQAVVAELSAVDYLVCNVGVGEYAKFRDYTFDMWNRVLTTNLTVPAFLIQRLQPHFREQGSILLVGSYAGRKAYSSSPVYGVSKAGLIFLGQALVKEFEGQGVRVNSIAPGFIETSWQDNRSEESYQRINRKIALHRFGEPEEVAAMAYQVLVNTYMNGAVIDIHGGYEYF